MYLNKGTTHSEKSQVKRPCMVRHSFRPHTLPTVIIQPKARSQHIPAQHRIMLPCSYNMKSPPKVQCTQCGLWSTQVALSARPTRTNPCCPSVWLQRCPKNHSHHSLMLLQQKHIYYIILYYIYKQVLSSNHIWKRNFPAFVDDFPTEISIYRGTPIQPSTSAPRLPGTEDPTSTVTKGRSPAAGMVWRGQRASEFWHFWWIKHGS